ncbi:MAG: Ig-like domain repeat protein [Methanobacteriaceae archaeon]|nr:Ig-like domain repeat protein [Methanobacteriaceae archaeon]
MKNSNILLIILGTLLLITTLSTINAVQVTEIDNETIISETTVETPIEIETKSSPKIAMDDYETNYQKSSVESGGGQASQIEINDNINEKCDINKEIKLENKTQINEQKRVDIKTANLENRIYIQPGNGTTGTGSIDNPYYWSQTGTALTELTDTVNTLYFNNGTYVMGDGYTTLSTNNMNNPNLTNKIVNIIGESSTNTIINGNNKLQILTITSGFTINIKNITFAQGNQSSGGAIYNNGNLTIIDSILQDNIAISGGAIYNLGNLQITKSTFKGNNATQPQSTGGGGAIFNRGNITIDGLTFNDNKAVLGGAIYNSKNLIINDTLFTDNNGTSNGNFYGGGAIYSNGGSIIIDNNIFKFNNMPGNTRGGSGGAIYILKGNLTIYNSKFINNTVYYPNGGAICFFGEELIIDNTLFENNTSGYYSGAVHTGTGINKITNCNFTKNTAKIHGGAVGTYESNSGVKSLIIDNCIFDQGWAGSRGGAIAFTGSQLLIDNTIITNITGASGAAILITGEKAFSNVTINNTKVINGYINRSGGCIDITSNAAVYVENTVFENNTIIDKGTDPSQGGAILIEKPTGEVILNNVTIANNIASYGGAVYNNGKLTIINSRFINNTATKVGGAIYGSNFTVENSEFIDNKALWGGAVYTIENSSVLLTNVKFAGNNATGTYGGGAIYNNGNLIIKIGNFTNNQATSNAGDTTSGGAINNRCNLTVYDSIFEENKAVKPSAGAIYSHGNTTVNNTIFIKNYAGVYGGAIYVAKDEFKINNSKFIENTVGTHGGAISTYDTTGIVTLLLIENTVFDKNVATGAKGGAIAFTSDNLIINNSNITNNNGETGAAVFIQGQKVLSNVIINNTNFINNTAKGSGGALDLRQNNIAYIENTLFENNTVTDRSETKIGYGGAIYNEKSVVSVSNVTLNKVTFINNMATQGGAIYNNGNATITNSIFVKNNGNGSAIFNNDNLTVKDSLFLDNNLTKNVIYIGLGTTLMETNWWGSNDPNFTEILNEPFNAPFEWIYLKLTVNDIDEKMKLITTDFNWLKKWNVDPRYESGHMFDGVDVEFVLTNNAGTINPNINQTLNGLSSSKFTFTTGSFEIVKIKTANVLTDVSQEIGMVSKPTIVVLTESVYANTITNITVKVTDSEGNNINEGVIILSVNGTIVGEANVTNGIANVLYHVQLPAGVYTFNVSYPKTINYDANSILKNITVNKNPTYTTVEKNTRYVGEEVYLVAGVVNGDAFVVVKGIVTFFIDNKEIGNVTLDNLGYARLKYTETKTPGVYTITAFYNGNEFYASSSGNAILNITLEPVHVHINDLDVYVNETAEVKSTVQNNKGENITTGVVIFKIDERVIGVANVTNGVAKINYTFNLPGGIYALIAGYNGSGKIIVEENSDLIVKIKPTTITSPNINAKIMETIELIAQVSSSYGIPTGTVEFILNKDILGVGELVNGVARIEWEIIPESFIPGSYNVLIWYHGNSEYETSNTTIILNLEKLDTIVQVTDSQSIPDGNITLVAEVTNNKHVVIIDGNMTFYVNGELVGITPVSNGKSELKYNIPENFKTGNYTITADYSGNKYNNMSSGNGILTILQIPTHTFSNNINATLREDIVLHAQVVSNVDVPYGNVSFAIGEQLIGINELNNGFANLNWTIPENYSEGTYEVEVSYLANERYFHSNINIKMDLRKCDSTVLVKDINCTIGDTVILYANVISDHGIPSGNVNFYIGNTLIGNGNLINGSIYTNWTIPKSYTLGNYDILAIYNGNNQYISSNNTINLTINKRNTEVTVSDIKALQGSNTNLTATVTNNKEIINGGNLVFYIDDNLVGKTIVVNGTGKINYQIPNNFEVQDHVIKVNYEGDEYNNPSTNIGILTIQGKIKTFMVVKNITALPETNVTLELYLIDKSNRPVTTGKVEFKLNNNTIVKDLIVQDGMVLYEYALPIGYTEGTYTLTGVYVENSLYYGVTSIANLTIEKQIDTIVNIENSVGKVNDTIKITATVTDLNNNPLNTGSVDLFIENQKIATINVINGTVIYDYTITQAIGEYVLRANYNGNSLYKSNFDTALLKVVTSYETNTIVNSFEALSGSNVTFKALIFDIVNNPVMTGNVMFKLDGNVIGTTIVNDGVALIGYSIPEETPSGNHNITVEYVGNEDYEPSTGGGILIISTKIASKSNISNIIDKAGETIELKAYFTDINDNLLQTGKVAFKINGVTLDGIVIINNGWAIKEYTIPSDYSSKDYIITAVFGGNGNYEATSCNGILTVDKLNTSINIGNIISNTGDVKTITALITASDIKIVNMGIVVFKINGNTIGNATVIEGMATYKYTIPQNYSIKNYTITGIYGENNRYHSSQNNATLTVQEKIETKIIMDNYIGKLNDTIKITATVTDLNNNLLNTGSVDLFIENQKIATINVTNGTVTYNYTITQPIGGYTVIANYTENKVYKSSSNESLLKVVSSYKTNTSVNSVEALSGTNVTFKAEVYDIINNPVLTGQVSFKLNGQTIGQSIVINGTASIRYSIPEETSSGNYTILAIYIKNNDYESSNNTGILTITDKIGSKVEVFDSVSKAGKTVILKAYFTDINDNPLQTGKVAFKINGITLDGTVIINNGWAIKEYTIPSDYSSKDYIITAVFGGNGNYEATSGNGILTISKTSVNISKDHIVATPGDTIVITATLTSEDNKIINEGIVVFKLNGKTIGNATVINGMATYRYTIPENYATKDYTITKVFTQSENYGEARVNATLTLKHTPTSIKISPEIAVKGDTIIIIGNITSENGNVINEGKAVIKVNNKTVATNLVVQNGIVQTVYKVPSNLNNVTVYIKYAGYQQYDLSTATKVLLLVDNSTNII